MNRATRRAFLRTTGGLVAIPFLPSWVRADAAPPKRFIAIYQPGGVLQKPNGSTRHNTDEWTCQHSGDKLIQLGLDDALHGAAGQAGMRAIGVDGAGAALFQRLGGLA